MPRRIRQLLMHDLTFFILSFVNQDCAECIETTGVDPMLIGDGKCNLELNNTMCGYDGKWNSRLSCMLSHVCKNLIITHFPLGHDCLATPVKCSVPDESLLGDGKCHGGIYNTAVCGYDGKFIIRIYFCI